MAFGEDYVSYFLVVRKRANFGRVVYFICKQLAFCEPIPSEKRSPFMEQDSIQHRHISGRVG